MKHNLLLPALLCASVFAQNPNIAIYPGAAPTSSDLLVASDFYATTLVSAMSATSMIIPTTSSIGLRFPTAVTVDSGVNVEIVKVCAASASSLVVCVGGRGFDHTSPRRHDAGARVVAAPVAWMLNQQSAEIEALATTLPGGALDGDALLWSASLGRYVPKQPGGAQWGQIGGSIGAQSDLWTILMAKQEKIAGAPAIWPTIPTNAAQVFAIADYGSPGIPYRTSLGAARAATTADLIALLGTGATAQINLGLALSATIDTTNAANILSGVLPVGRLPAATASALGGVKIGAGVAVQADGTISVSTAYDASGAAAAVQSASLQKSSNLSDLSDAGTARTNLGLGSAALSAASAFEPAIAAGTASQVWLGNKTWAAISSLSIAASQVGSGYPYSSLSGALANPMTTAGDFLIGGTLGAFTRLAYPGPGMFCPNFSSGTVTWAACPGASGVLSSVGLTMPAGFTVGNSPLTANGSIGVTLASQTSSYVLIAPTAGGVPTWRALLAADVPTLNQNTTGTAAGLSGTQTAKSVYAAPNGSSGTASFRALVASDLSFLAASATTDATNASNISSGTLPAARLPVPSASTLGGTESITCGAGTHMSGISTAGVPACSADTGASIAWYTISTSTSAALNAGYKVTASGITLTLPTGTTTGQQVMVISTLAAGSSFLVAPASTQKVMGGASGVTVDVPNAGFRLTYFSDTSDWRMF